MLVTTDTLRVAIVEDQRQLREGLASLIDRSPGLQTAGSFGSMEDAIGGFLRAAPDVALVDINLPGMSGIEGLPRLKEIQPGLQVVMLTVLADDDHIVEAICMGAAGYLLKDTPPQRIVSAIAEVAQGGSPMTPEVARKVVSLFKMISTPRVASTLTDRELEVLNLLAEGHTYRSAGATLGISAETVRFHIRHVYEKLQVNSKSEAVLKAYRAGLLRQR